MNIHPCRIHVHNKDSWTDVKILYFTRVLEFNGSWQPCYLLWVGGFRGRNWDLGGAAHINIHPHPPPYSQVAFTCLVLCRIPALAVAFTKAAPLCIPSALLISAFSMLVHPLHPSIHASCRGFPSARGSSRHANRGLDTPGLDDAEHLQSRKWGRLLLCCSF